ncbi:MAG: sugar phosphate nucleotidyltransferase [Patescibacteria group bacterium]
MKVLIAAAGRGTRMKELGIDKPKHLLEVKGKPFLYYLLENIKKAGFKDIIVVGGYKAEKIEEFISGYDKNIKVINQWDRISKEKYGTVCPIEAARNELKDDNFIFISGDNYYSALDLKKMKKNDDMNYAAYYTSKYPELYGVVRYDKKDYLEEIVEKPMKHIGNEISIGLYKFTPEIFSKIEKIDKSTRGEYELVDAVNRLAKERQVKVIEHKKHWFDFGKPEDVPVLEEFLHNEKII